MVRNFIAMDIESINENRLKQITELNSFVEHIENDFNQILSNLNWTQAKLFADYNSKEVTKKHTNNDADYKAIQEYYLLPVEKKLERYEHTLKSNEAIDKELDMTQFEFQTTSLDMANKAKAKVQNTFADINKLKRDLKRRRMKYRTTKAPPLTYTEELRELIGLQMEMNDKKL